MKKFNLFLLLLSIISCVSLNAQENEKNSLFTVSTGMISFNNSEQIGISLSNEYIRNINSHFAFGAKIIFAHGEGNVEGLKPRHDVHISTSALDLNGFFVPIHNEKNLLLIGAGLSTDYTRTSYLSNIDYIERDDKIYTIADTDGLIYLFEPVFSLHYYRTIKSNILIGLNINSRDFDFHQNIIAFGGGVVF